MARGVWELRESFAPNASGRKAQNRFTDFYDFERVRLAVQLLVVDTFCVWLLRCAVKPVGEHLCTEKSRGAGCLACTRMFRYQIQHGPSISPLALHQHFGDKNLRN